MYLLIILSIKSLLNVSSIKIVVDLFLTLKHPKYPIIEKKLYNKIVNLSRNKLLYTEFALNDTFQNRINLIFIHVSFLFTKIKYDENVAHYKEFYQKLFDYTFSQIEINMREIGYGDQSINKKMKDYINLFYSMLDKIHDWESSSDELKKSILLTFLDENIYHDDLIKYLDNYRKDLSNNPLNFYIKGVVKA